MSDLESADPEPVAAEAATRTTYLIVDGENIDATLGMSVLNHRPTPDERPRWERVRTAAATLWGQPVKALFFLNASSRELPMSFIQALLAMDFRPVPLSGGPGQKVVDIGIERTLEALVTRPGDVVLVSHDGDFHDRVAQLLGPSRRVALFGFREFVNARFTALAAAGLEILDLEDDVGAFTHALPRVRVIDIDDFDPVRYL